MVLLSAVFPRGKIQGQIARNVAIYFAAACLVVLLLLSVGQLSALLQQVASGNLPLSVVLQLLGLGIPALMVTVIPLALFFAVYLVFSNLYRHNEMVAIRSAGLGLGDLVRGLTGFVLAVLVLELLLSLYWAPAARKHLQDESARLASAATQALIQPGSFANLPDGRVVYVGQAASGSNRYREIFLDLAGRGKPDIATASYGEIRVGHGGGVSLILIDGRRYMGVPGAAGFKIWRFARYRVELAAPAGAGAHQGGFHWSSAPLPGVWGQLHVPGHFRYALAELEWRLFWPLLIPVIALLAVPLAYSSPRRSGRAAGLLVGILLLLGSNNLLVFLRSRLTAGSIGGFPGLFWVLLVLLALASYTFVRRNRDRPVFPDWPGILNP